MRLSKQLFQDRFYVPDGWPGIPSHKLLERVGLVEFTNAGLPSFLPIGKRIMDNISRIVREEVNAGGYSEISLPLLQRRELLVQGGRAEKFLSEFMVLQGELRDFILAPTNEEAYDELCQRGVTSYRQLPVKLYQIADKFRNIRRSKGILRSRQFLMCDMISVCPTSDELQVSVAEFEQIVHAVTQRLGISVLRVAKDDNRYVDFVIPCPEGELQISMINSITSYSAKHAPESLAASSIAMYFIFQGPRASFQDRDGQVRGVHIGTFGFGIQRCLHATVEIRRDDLGLCLAREVRPFDLSLLVIDPDDPSQRAFSEQLYIELLASPYKVLYDDRSGKLLKEKAALSDFYGVPLKLIIGVRETKANVVTLKLRSRVSPVSSTISAANIASALNDTLPLL